MSTLTFTEQAELIALIESKKAAYVAPAVFALTPEQSISQLETLFTQRRLRELLLTGDKTFLQQLDSQIAAERVKISKK